MRPDELSQLKLLAARGMTRAPAHGIISTAGREVPSGSPLLFPLCAPYPSCCGLSVLLPMPGS